MSRRALVDFVLLPALVLTLGMILTGATVLGQEVRGSGPDFRAPLDIAVESTGTLVVVDDGLEALVRVDPISGNRTILSDANTGQ